jgi:plastocyanin
MRHSSLICALLATSLSFCAPQAAPAPSTIAIKNFNFSPVTQDVTVGSTVTWHNDDGEPHTVVGIDGSFRSAALDTGESFAFKFTKAGVYKYICSIHPRMTGTITVK